MVALIAGLLASAAIATSCEYDRASALVVDQQAFDQSPMGWRQLETKTCYLEAADLIRDWRRANGSTATILAWHEGQNRAKAGQVRSAITLFRHARKRPDEEMAEAWNLYVDGSIAFLNRDRQSLIAARKRLATTVRPMTFHSMDASGTPVPIEWPPNLAVLDSLIRCWAEPYRRAYSC